ncbi:MAG: hypothetical protein ACXWZF_08255 [Actinomycetota bacterium]
MCDFDLRIKSLQNDIVDKTFYDANGDPKRIVSKGKLIVKVVNLETGDWLVRNASGPVFVWINSDGSAHVSAPRRQIVLLFGGNEGGSGLLYIRGPYDTRGTSRLKGSSTTWTSTAWSPTSVPS